MPPRPISRSRRQAYFPFGGARDSFFGDLKVHGRDAFEFYMDKKVTISR
jgi:malonate-semialdehyde dehydrogenase (acetylating)/methylmalonate-semialdehyde dehydrogenase